MSLLLAIVASTCLLRQDVPLSRTMKIGPRDVLVTLPMGTAIPPTVPFFKSEGWNYLYRDGQIIGRERGDVWNEIASLYPASQTNSSPSAVTWHTKIVVFTRSNIIDVGRDGILRERRVTTNDELMAKLQQGIGQFVMLAEAYGRGQLKMDIEVTFDNDLMPVYSDGKAKPFGVEFARNYFNARINSGGFKGDDGLYRGPYQSVFYISNALTDGPSDPIIVRNSPVSGISFFRNRHSDEVGGLALALQDQWVKHAAWHLKAAGLTDLQAPTDEKIDNIVPRNSWKTVVDASPASYLKNRTVAAVAKPWSEVKVDPLASLPILKVAEPGLRVRFDSIEGFLSQTPDAEAVAFKGLYSEAGINYFVLDHTVEFDPKLESAEPVKLPSQITTVEGLAHSPNVSATLELLDGNPVINYKEDGQARYGSALLLQLPQALEAVTLEAKTDTDEPLAINVLDEQHHVLRSFVLGRIDPSPREIDLPGTALHLDFSNDKSWHPVTLSLSGLSGSRYLQVAPPITTAYFERSQIDPIVYQFRNFLPAKGETTASPFGVKPDASSNDIFARAAFAQTVPINDPAFKRLLDDQERMVVLNALTRLSKEPSAAFETQMIKRANDVDPAVAAAALEAMYALNNPASMAYRRHILQASPFELNRAMAAQVLARTKLGSLAGPFSQLIASKSSYVRYLGAEAVSQLEGDDAPVILMVFLQEENPATRLIATAGAQPTVDLVSRRLQWSAQNDPSDAVRGASYLKLLQSGIEKYVLEGRKWITDASTSPKLDVLIGIADNKLSAEGATVSKALSDPDPLVRLQAIKTSRILGLAPDKGLLNDEKDPRVLEELAKG